MAVARHQRAGERYLQVLADSLERMPLPRKRVEVQRVHLGGGTPTWLSDDQLARLRGVIDEYFMLTSDGQWSIEVDPGTVDEGRLRLLTDLGFSRVSFGVQSLDPRVLEAVGRPQQAESIARLVDYSHELGLQVAVDLMSGLPHQDANSVRHTVEQVVKWRPERVAVFAYAHVPWVKKHQAGLDQSALPESVERARAMLGAREALVSHAYVPIGMDHFALPGDPLLDASKLHRNFMGYTTLPDVDLIGLGPSAISEVSGVYWQAPSKLARWMAHDPPARGHLLSSEDLQRKAIIEDLMCGLLLESESLEAAGLCGAIEQLSTLEAAGVVDLDGGGVRVVEPLAVRLVARVFDAYRSSGRFSQLF
jgi:oxygen-independent coproporphyrinogen-3 oxidase